MAGGFSMKLNVPYKTKEMMQIGMPCFIEQALVVVAGIISTAIVGNLGRNELTAVTMSTTLITWINCTFTGISVGATILVGRMWGAGEKDRVRDVFDQTLKLNLAISILFMTIGLLFQKQIIGLFYGGAEQAVLDAMYVYMPFCLIRMPCPAITTAFGSVQRGAGDNVTSLVGSTALNVSNLIVSPILIYGIEPLGIPGYGLYGAGVAQVIIWIIPVICQFIYVTVTKKSVLPKKFNLKLDKELIVRLVRVAIPTGLDQFLFQGGFVLLQSVLVSFGTIFQAGYQIAANLNGIITTPSTVIAIASTTMIAQSLGANDHEGALETVKANKFFIYTIFSVIGILFFLFAPLLVRIYTDDAEVLKEAIFFVRVLAVESVLVGYMQAMAGILKGAGDVRYIAVTNLVALWIGRLFVVWLLALTTGDGHIAMVVGLTLDFGTRAVMFGRKVKKGNWLYLKV